MRYLFTIFLALSSLTLVYGQQKQKIIPPPLKISEPPKLIPPLQLTKQSEADSLLEHATTFRSDTLYSKTDSSFQAIQWVFEPTGSGKAWLFKETYSYPERYTKDSIEKKKARYPAITNQVFFQDGAYAYDQNIPKKSTRLIFTDQKTNKRTFFRITWEGTYTKRKIVGLLDEDTTVLLVPGSPRVLNPVGY